MNDSVSTEARRYILDEAAIAAHQSWAVKDWTEHGSQVPEDAETRRVVFRDGIVVGAIVDSRDGKPFSYGIRARFKNDLSKMGMSNCVIEGLDARSSFMKNCDFSGSSFNESDFKRATVAGSNFRGCRLYGTDFTGADLIWDGEAADFRGAAFYGTNLAGVAYRYEVTPDIRGAFFADDVTMPCGVTFGELVDELLPQYVLADGRLAGLKGIWEGNLKSDGEAATLWRALIDRRYARDGEATPRWRDLMDRWYARDGKTVPAEHWLPLADIAWLFDHGLLGSASDVLNGVRPAWRAKVSDAGPTPP